MRGKTLKPMLKPVSEETEPHAGEIKFKIHKFTKRPKTHPRNTIIFPCFSEFGTEILGTLYCLPTLLQRRYMGKYSIAVGWQGRAFLYKHLVDEFWEIGEEHQWLREYCRAFHHCSRNLTRVEKDLMKQGKVIGPLEIGEPAVYPKLVGCLIQDCGGKVMCEDGGQKCQKCGCMFPGMGIFYNPVEGKKLAVWPNVSVENLKNVAKYIKPNSVGITARNRICYGRNLPSHFYERLIYLLEDLGYNPIWIGEKSTTLPCPFPRVTDFSSTPEAQDLENTLALVSQLKFTIQYWTASTRLAGLVGTPYILFESPDQVLGGTLTPGHEGYRIYLCTRGNKKLVLTHFKDVESNHNYALGLTKQAVADVERENFKDIVGMMYGTYGKRS